MNSTSHPLRVAFAFGIAFALLAVGVVFGAAVPAHAATFDHEAVISNANMRDQDSMSEREIQAFLDAQTGPLKTLVTTDYAGVQKPASRIIWEACQQWAISPKVILTLLQKEQSLLTRTTLEKNTLSRAIGAGCPNRTTNKYPGFGQQMWHGARLLDGYGEGKNGSTIALYYPGILKEVYKPSFTGTWPVTKRVWSASLQKYVTKYYIRPKNIATYKLYVYNPSIGAKAPYGDLSTQACSGNASFWKIYRRHFGSTFANPRMRRVFRLRNRYNGTYLYTTSVTERYHKTSKHSATWGYAGTAFSVDTSVTTTSTVPVYRFYNKVTHKYSFIRSQRTYLARRSVEGQKTWSYGGIAFRVSGEASPESLPVFALVNRRNGGRFLTSSRAVMESLRETSALRATWAYQGVAFHLPRHAAP